MTTRRPQILTQSLSGAVLRAAEAPTPGQWIAFALFAVTAVAAFNLVANPAPELVPTQVIQLELPPPELAVVETTAAGYWLEGRIRRGDTIGNVLSRLGVEDPAAMEFLR